MNKNTIVLNALTALLGALSLASCHTPELARAPVGMPAQSSAHQACADDFNAYLAARRQEQEDAYSRERAHLLYALYPVYDEREELAGLAPSPASKQGVPEPLERLLFEVESVPFGLAVGEHESGECSMIVDYELVYFRAEQRADASIPEGVWQPSPTREDASQEGLPAPARDALDPSASGAPLALGHGPENYERYHVWRYRGGGYMASVLIPTEYYKDNAEPAVLSVAQRCLGHLARLR